MTPLERRIRPGTAGAPVLVLMHGRGADEADMLGLADYFPREWTVVAPRAPFSGIPWGYGPGYAWYRFLGGARPEPESFATTQAALREFLATLPDSLPPNPGPLVLGGFSQGGTTALGHALGFPGSAPLIVNLSGFLPEHPSVPVTAASVAQSEIFWGHGVVDPNIPFALAESGWQRLQAAGARLTAKSYRMGHTIGPDELADLIAWIQARAVRSS